VHARRFVLAVAFVCLAACNGESPQDPDGGGQPPDAPPFMLCGNSIVEGTEACDDGNDDADDGCSPSCELECGDGAVTGTEQCDPAIAAGSPGACPTDETCVDEDPCTTGVVSGTGCEVVCEFATTTAPIDGDSCCPDGADGTTDSDCEAVCGNGVLEAGEACDTSIEAGLAGACPTACNDGEDCTADALVDGGTCDAHCVAPEITTPGPDDGCCPGGATPGTDPDCSTTCGDGVVSGDETCDTGIPGSCPTACNDGDACTVDSLVNAGTCRASCTTSPTAPGPADTCCPAGSDLGDDPDCPPTCGDGVITPPETCDDNNDTAGDGCSASCRIEPVAFRFTDLDIRDPHLFATVPILNCTDVTNLSLFGIDGVNPMLQTSIQTDADDDDDTFLDLSIVNTFAPLVQTNGTTTLADLTFPDCTSPMSSTSCTLAAGEPHTTATATNKGSGVCLAAEPNTTTGGYTPALLIPTAPSGGSCYSANAGTVTFMLGDLPITLIDANIGGEWFGNPATEVRDGMIRGFLTQATADATIIPEGLTGIDSIDGSPLSSLLPGGTNNCSKPAPQVGDLDTLAGTTTKGWYFYLNFSAARVSYVEQ
jgi:cysteine-rich repeat protein